MNPINRANAIAGTISDKHHVEMLAMCNAISYLLSDIIKNSTNHSIHRLSDIFEDLKSSLVEHLEQEETILFPYLRILEEFRKSNKSYNQAVKLTLAPLKMLKEDHKKQINFVKDMDFLMSGIVSSNDNYLKFSKLYKVFKEELISHITIEEAELYPKIELIDSMTTLERN